MQLARASIILSVYYFLSLTTIVKNRDLLSFFQCEESYDEAPEYLITKVHDSDWAATTATMACVQELGSAAQHKRRPSAIQPLVCGIQTKQQQQLAEVPLELPLAWLRLYLPITLTLSGIFYSIC